MRMLKLDQFLYAQTFCVLVLVSVSILHSIQAGPVLPLSAKSRWIVDQSGNRVKLACVNWAGHTEAMLPEGLNKKPASTIAETIASLGFNCVRLTWATWMWTNDSLGLQTVTESLHSLGLMASADGVALHNPELADVTVRQAYKSVVRTLGEHDVMVLLDNHVSKPQWCCGEDDGNGWWGDEYFDVETWKDGLTIVASTFKDTPNVVAMSLRNELRGQNPNIDDWYKYEEEGADAVHAANPNVLVVVGGTHYTIDLSFIRSKQLNLTMTHKLVYEMHWYAWTTSEPYSNSDLDNVCAFDMNRVDSHTRFLIEENQSFTGPLIVSEFGMDETATTAEGTRFMNCAFAYFAQNDLDWALWALQGSYYYRNSQEDFEETYAVLTFDWNGVRNPEFLARLQALQPAFQGPGVGASGTVFFHPATGLCMSNSHNSSTGLGLTSCMAASEWTWDSQGHIQVEASGSYCVNAVQEEEGLNVQVQLSKTGNCTEWQTVSNAKLQISTKIGNTTVCLDGSSIDEVNVDTCVCVDGCNTFEDPSGQWLELIQLDRDLVKYNVEIPAGATPWFLPV